MVDVPPKGKVTKSRYFVKSNTENTKMGEELPILKGILKGNVNYHNARKLSDPKVAQKLKLESERAKHQFP